MKKSIIYFIFSVFLFGGIVSCNKLTDINTNSKLPLTAPAGGLVAYAQERLSNDVTSANVNSNVFRLLAQQWTETTYTDESRYNLTTRSVTQYFWNPLYRDVLKNLDAAEKLIKDDKTISDPQLQKNQIAIVEMLTVYTYSILVNTYGNVPYTEALNPENLTPKYDDAAAIYADLIKRLDVALGSINTSSKGFDTYDLVYGGSVSKWISFGNSLKLKLALTLADVDPANSKVMAEAAAPKVFMSNDDNALFNYLTSPPHTNPVWVDLVQSGRFDFVGANTIIDTLNKLQDPRLKSYFDTTANGVYLGGVFGAISNPYANFSLPNPKLTKETFPGVLLDYVEVEFYLAEAVERGFNVGGTAESHYNNAITASIKYWGGSDADAATYLAKPSVAYATATGSYKQKIGFQKWLGMYNRGLEAWTEYRRLDAPKLNLVPKPLGDYPNRFTYPVDEQNLNPTNYNAASTAIGGDLITNKVFWDKF